MKGVKKAEIVEVIRIRETVGEGTPKDPVREAIQYWEKSGKKIAEKDERGGERTEMRYRIDAPKAKNEQDPVDQKDKRYAFEWFMRAEDERYWKMTQSLIRKKTRKAACYMSIFTTAFLGVPIIYLFYRLHKSG